ncbi:MAG TPA: zinc ribbon domain-containing protein [Solirubrobacteraceae bacterium]|nr:zinc ribbon domain-containing protein [Solirubrobacteraceae bacterium]
MPRLPRMSRRAPDQAEASDATTELPVAIPADAGINGPPSASPTAAPTDAPATPAAAPAAPAPAATGAPATPAAADGAAAPAAEGVPAAEEPGQQAFLHRGRMRRRLRYLRRARELAFRDLGGLIFDLHRFARSREDLVLAKLERLAAIDVELRTLERALDDRQEVMVLREPGVAACPRCGSLHGSDANFCPNCALPVQPKANLPLAGGPAAPPSASAPTIDGPPL